MLWTALRSPSDSFRTPSSLHDAHEVCSRQIPRATSSTINHTQIKSRQTQNLPFRDSNPQSLNQTGAPGHSVTTPQVQPSSNFDSPAGPTEQGPTASQQRAHQQQVSEMTEAEKYGLPGLMAQIQNNTFFPGQELSSLEIDLEKSVFAIALDCSVMLKR